MTPKIVVYFKKDGKAEYKILRSIETLPEILKETSNWPIYVDLSFNPRIATNVDGDLSNLPKLAFLSESMANADLPLSCEFLESRITHIGDRKAYPIISFMGNNLLDANDPLLLELVSAKLEVVEDHHKIFDLVLSSDLNNYGFSSRTMRAFSREKIFTINDLLNLSEREISWIPNSANSLEQVRNVLNQLGITQKHLDTNYDVNLEKLKKYVSEYGYIFNQPDNYNGMDGNSTQIKNEPEQKNIFENLIISLDNLDERQRTVLEHRLGLYGDRKTLSELKHILKVHPNTIRLTEAKAVQFLKSQTAWNPRNLWGKTLDEAFNATRVPLSPEQLVAIDKRFSFTNHSADALLNVLTSELISGLDYFKVEIFNQTFLARIKQAEINSTIKAIDLMKTQLAGKSETEVKEAIKGIIPYEISEFRKILIDKAFLNYNNGPAKLRKKTFSYSKDNEYSPVAENLYGWVTEPINRDKIYEYLNLNYPNTDKRKVTTLFKEMPGVYSLGQGNWGTIKMLNFSDQDIEEISKLINEFLEKWEGDYFHAKKVKEHFLAHNASKYLRLNFWHVVGIIRYLNLAKFANHQMFLKFSADPETKIDDTERPNNAIHISGTNRLAVTEETIVKLKRQGWTNATIAGSLKIPLDQVNQTLKKNIETESIVDPNKVTNLPWTDARVATLKEMWIDGNSASTIAKKLGGTSRNAVISKAKRLELPPKDPSKVNATLYKENVKNVDFSSKINTETGWLEKDLRKLEILKENFSTIVLSKQFDKSEDDILKALRYLGS